MKKPTKKPYVGPRTFEATERDRFFGRDREARELLALTVSERLVLFYAQSGAGKSSLINTCLIPDLIKKRFEVFPVVRVGGDAPPGVKVDNIYVFNLIRILASNEFDALSLAKLSLGDFFAKLRKDSPSDSPSAKAKPGSARRILIIDQFEELFSTHQEQWEKRGEFFAQLAQAMEDDPFLSVVLVMREDYIASLDPYAALVPGKLRMRYYMQRLGQEAALKAIKTPVEKLLPYEDGVAEKLVADLCSIKVQKPDGTPGYETGQYVEPVQLQVVCYGLWENLDWENLPDEGAQITARDASSVGDVDQALGLYYRERVKGVADTKHVKERKIRQWFGEKLIAAGGIRSLVLAEPNIRSGELDDDVIQALQSDLVRAEKRGGATWYELTHDRLVVPIQADNQTWFDEHSSPLQRQARLWIDQGRTTNWLSRDEALVDIIQWAEDNQDEVSKSEQEFLDACKEEQDQLDKQRTIEEMELRQVQAEARSARQARLLTIVAFSLFAVALIASGFAISSARTAENSARQAATNEAAAIAAQATAQTSVDFSRANELAKAAGDPSLSMDQSVLLSVAAYKKAPYSLQAQQALSDNFQRLAQLEKIYSNPENPAKDFELSPDGQVVSIWGDRGITLWNQAGKGMRNFNTVQPLSLKMHFSPDSSIMAAVDSAGVLLWDTVSLTQKTERPLNFHTGGIQDMALGNGGKTLVTLGEDNSVQYWDLSSLEAMQIRVESEEIVLHSSGVLLTALDRDGNTELWSIPENKVIGEPIFGESPVLGSDGSLLATVNIDGSISLLDAKTLDSIAVIDPEFDGDIIHMVFSPDGNALALTDTNLLTKIWDVNRKEQIGRSVIGTPRTFSPNGDILFVYSDGTVQPYCVHLGETAGTAFSGTVTSFGWSGKAMAVKDDSGIISLWNIMDTCKLEVNEAVTLDANAVLFSPRENVFAGIADDGTITVQTLVDGVPADDPLTLNQATTEGADTDQTAEAQPVTDRELLFNHDGRLLALLEGGSLKVWDTTNDAGPIAMPSALSSGPVTDLLFTEDDILVAARQDGTIIIWDTATGDSRELPTNTKGQITDLLFDPEFGSDGGNRRMLSISDHSVFLMDATTGESISGPMDGKFLDVHWESGQLATTIEDRIVVWEIESGDRINESPIPGGIAHFTADGRAMLVSEGTEMALYSTTNFVQTHIPAPLSDLEEARYEPGRPIDIEFSPNGKSFAMAQLGTLVSIFRVGVDSLQFLGTSAYNYGGFIEFGSDTSLYFNELSAPSYLDKLNWDNNDGRVDSIDITLEGTTALYLDPTTYLLGKPVNRERDLMSVSLYDIRDFESSGPVLTESINVSLDQSTPMQDFRFRRIEGEGGSGSVKMLATLGEDGKVYLWNLAGDLEETDSAGNVKDSKDDLVITAAISPSGEKQATYTRDGIVLAAVGGSQPSPAFNDHILKIESVHFNEDGNILAGQGENSQVIFYDLRSQKRIGEPIEGSLNVDYSDLGIWVTVNSNNETSTIWDSGTGGKIMDLPAGEALAGISSGGGYIAVQALPSESESEATFRLWDASNNKQMGGTIPGVFKGFSPDDDTNYFAAESGGEITIYITTSSPLNSAHEPIPGSFFAFSPDGRYLALGNPDGNIALLNIAEQEFSEPIEGDFLGFAPGPQTSVLAYRSSDQIYLWNVVVGGVIGRPISGEEASFSSDGLALEVRHYDPNTGMPILNLLNVETGQLMVGPFAGYQAPGDASELPSIYFSFDEKGLILVDHSSGRINKEPIPGELQFLASGGEVLATTATDTEGNTATRLWNRSTGEAVGDEIDLAGLIGISPNGSTLIERDLDDNYRLLNALDPSRSPVLIEAETILLSSDRQFAVGLSKDEKKLSIWNLDSRTVEDVDLPDVNPGSIERLFAQPGGNLLVLSGRSGIVLVDVEGEKQTVTLQEKTGLVSKMGFSPAERYLATLGSDGVIVWNANPPVQVIARHDPDKRIIDFSFGGNDTIIYLSEDFEIFTFDITFNRSTSLRKLVNNPAAVCAHSLSPDGSKVAFQVENHILLWDGGASALGPVLTNIQMNNSCGNTPGSMAFDPGSTILAIGDGQRIHIWDVDTGTDSLLNGLGVFVFTNRIVFSSEKTIAVEGVLSFDLPEDTSIILWDTGSRLKVDEPFDGGLTGLNSNASKLFYRDPDGNVVLLDLLNKDLSKFDEMRDSLCAVVAGSELTPGEWKQFFPNEDQEPICAGGGRICCNSDANAIADVMIRRGGLIKATRSVPQVSRFRNLQMPWISLLCESIRSTGSSR